MDKTTEDRLAVYEIGYLLTTAAPEDKIPAEADKVRKIITDAGASVISEEAPHWERLAYTMRVKTLSGSYEKYDEAYFGWIKFEVGSDRVESIKKSVESLPIVLRMLLITTVKENTYLGKRAPEISTKIAPVAEEKKEAAPASIEEMDKSIDEMVKEV